MWYPETRPAADSAFSLNSALAVCRRWPLHARVDSAGRVPMDYLSTRTVSTAPIHHMLQPSWDIICRCLYYVSPRRWIKYVRCDLSQLNIVLWYTVYTVYALGFLSWCILGVTPLRDTVYLILGNDTHTHTHSGVWVYRRSLKQMLALYWNFQTQSDNTKLLNCDPPPNVNLCPFFTNGDFVPTVCQVDCNLRPRFIQSLSWGN